MSQIVVIGLGRFGHHVVRELHATGHEVLAIDIDEEHVQEVRDHCDTAVVMDARDLARLEALGVGDFDIAVVSLGERIEASTLVTLHLKDLKVPRIITKAGSADHGRLLELIGAHEVLFPEQEAAKRLARRLVSANILDFVPLGDSYSIHEIAPPDAFVGHSLVELQLRSRYGIQVLGVHNVLTDELSLNPDPHYQITDSDSLLVLGPNSELDRLRKL
ncbi:MAG: potassium channel family protein [Thermoanaerobaculia bacterium]